MVTHPQAALRFAFPQGAPRPRGTLWGGDAHPQAALRDQWNGPVLWPLAAAVMVLAVFGLVARGAWRRRERGKGRLDVGAT